MADAARTNASGFRSVLVTGGAGYVGSALVPALIRAGYAVKVVDLFWYGRDVFPGVCDNPQLTLVDLDIRDSARLAAELAGTDVVIHLACISNDSSFELDRALGRSINYDAFGGLLEGAVRRGVKRFIYASSSSVYGVKDEAHVSENTPPTPLTDYSRYKLWCERDLLAHPNPGGMTRVILRPATVCGYAPRMRLDLTVNLLTIHALVNRRIRVFGGAQLRPNIHIADMVRVYLELLAADRAGIDGQAFNAGYRNLSVESIACLVKDSLGDADIDLVFEPTSDLRSYHVNSDKLQKTLGFKAEHTVEEAVRSVAAAWTGGLLPKPLTNALYWNVERMKELGVT